MEPIVLFLVIQSVLTRCNARFLFCKDGAICAKNSPKHTSQGVGRAIVKGTSLRSPSPIMDLDITYCVIPHYSKPADKVDLCILVFKVPTFSLWC